MATKAAGAAKEQLNAMRWEEARASRKRKKPAQSSSEEAGARAC